MKFQLNEAGAPLWSELRQNLKNGESTSFHTGIDLGWAVHETYHIIIDCFKELQQSRRSSRSGSGGRCKSRFRSCILTARSSRTLKKNNRKNTDIICIQTAEWKWDQVGFPMALNKLWIWMRPSKTKSHWKCMRSSNLYMLTARGKNVCLTQRITLPECSSAGQLLGWDTSLVHLSNVRHMFLWPSGRSVARKLGTMTWERKSPSSHRSCSHTKPNLWQPQVCWKKFCTPRTWQSIL